MAKKPVSEHRREYMRRFYREHAEEIKAYSRDWAKGYRARIKADPEKHAKTKKRIREFRVEKRRKIREEVLDAYGGVCACCGEAERVFLTVDHINGDGAAHRREVCGTGSGRGGGSTMYEWLKKQGFPKDRFQILCYNCNCGRQRNGGVCPHALRR